MEIDWRQKIGETLVEQNDKESHRELDPNTFHPSQLAKCRRQCYLSKLGIRAPDEEGLGGMIPGQLIHEFIEREVEVGDSILHEHSFTHEENGIRFVGTTDCWDVVNETIYDFKTTGAHQCSDDNFYYLDEDGNQEHKDQLLIYMRALEASNARVINICKKNITHIRPWPEEGFYQFNKRDFDRLVDKANEIKRELEEHGAPHSPGEVPFEKDDCWLCEREQEEHLTFSHFQD